MAVTPNFQALGTQVGGTGLQTYPWPPSHAIGDYAIWALQTSNESATPVTDAQGFEEIAFCTIGSGVAGAAGSTRITLLGCFASSTAMPSPSATVPDHQIGRITTLRNTYNVGAPWDQAASSVSTAATSTAVSVPGGTTTLNNCLLCIWIGNGIDSAGSQVSAQANASLAAVTERFDSNSSAGNGGGVCLTTGTLDVAGVYGATTATLAATSVQALIALVIKPIPVLGNPILRHNVWG